MSWVVSRRNAVNGRCEYVRPPGSSSSFTPFKHKARRYPTQEAAAQDCCENERVEEL